MTETPTSQLLVVSENGYGKRTDLAQYRARSRGGRALGDLEHRGQPLRTALKEAGMGLLTPATLPKRLKLSLS